MFKLTGKLAFSLILLLLCACVPTVTKVFQAPKVTGQVIDLETLQPLSGVNVAHFQSTAKFVTTNTSGEFVLPSISETEFKMLMAGHALKDNLISIYNQDNQITLIAQSTLNGRAEETVELSTIIFDAEPKTIAPPSKSTYLAYNLLRTYFYPHSLMGSCDRHLSIASLASLNSSRKLASFAISHPNNKMRARYKKLAAKSYQRTLAIWQELKSTCKQTNSNYQDIKEVLSSIEEEVLDSELKD